MNSVSIAFIFKLINFGIVIGLVVYVYRRYAAPSLAQSMFEQHKKTQSLEHTIDDLQDEQRQIEQDIADDKALGMRLQRTVRQWHEHVAQVRMHKQHEQQKIVQRITDKRQQQAAIYHKKVQYQYVFPRAYGLAKQELTERYVQPASHEAYMRAILDTMERSS